ncbi:hypothetical protein SteCoe_21764 [Stentor coeruleus]|uniref:C2H2-type domain-containing protein n=1 Tax=Stentor coeruleus TaxID=5963 RepID=A0A1R2BNP1_9CILI|nr:hypothetical protein SteCoe_21764 [Stentor coeruleus]
MAEVINKMKVFEDYIVKQYCCIANGCGKFYTTKLNLKRHILISHVAKDRFQCPDCEKCFSSKQNLTEHSYLHSGQKPYECRYCGQKFRHISSLSVHYKYHRLEGDDDLGVEEKEVIPQYKSKKNI